MNDVFSNSDLVKIITYSTNITSGQQYKAIIATCREWHEIVTKTQSPHRFMDVPSTLFMQNRDLKWRVWEISHLLSMDILSPYCEYYCSIVGIDPDFNHQRCDFWYHLSLNPKITREIILKYKQHLCVPQLINLPIFSELMVSDFDECIADFHNEEYDYWNIAPIIVLNKMITYYRRKSNQELNIQWGFISKNCNITKEFIQQHQSSLPAQKLVENRYLPFDILLMYRQYANYNQLSSNYNLTPEYIKSKISQFNWHYLSSNRALTMELITQYIEHINWFSIWLNPNITSEFIREHIARVGWQQLTWNSNIPIDIIRDFGDNMTWNTKHIRKMPLDLIIKYDDVISWTLLLQNPHATIEFLQANIERFKGVLYD
jgi:hypothetical protein